MIIKIAKTKKQPNKSMFYAREDLDKELDKKIFAKMRLGSLSNKKEKVSTQVGESQALKSKNYTECVHAGINTL